MEGPSPTKHASTAGVDDNVVKRLNADIERLQRQLGESQTKLKEKEDKLTAANLKIEQYEAGRLQLTDTAQSAHYHEVVPSASVCIPSDLSLCGSFHIDTGIELFICFQ